jgi:hypothetical protein
MSEKSQERHFCRKKRACGTEEDLNRVITCPKNPRNVILDEKKTPAARKKTSPGYHSQMALLFL